MAFRSNTLFYIGTFIFVLFAVIWFVLGEHGDAIIWFSERRSSILDNFFIYFTKIGEEWTYVVLLLILLFYNFRNALLVFALAVLVPTVSLLSKAFFAQPRPKRYFTDLGIFEQINLVQGVEVYAAHTSFPSGHTMSAFAVLGFAAFVFRKFRWASFLLLGMAILVAISRVYLVQHFLIDVSAGAVLGSAIAYIVSWMSLRLSKAKPTWLEKNLLTFKDGKVKA